MSGYGRLPGVPSEPGEEVDAELAFHLLMRAAELEAEGMDADAAWRLARRQFGDIEATRRYCERLTARRGRRAWVREGVDMVRAELRYAWRQVRRHPGFGLVAILTIALGIGSTTAIFSAVHAVLLRPLPYPAPDELVRVHAVHEGARWTSSPADYLDWREQSEVFGGMAAYAGATYTLTGAGSSAERVSGARVASSFFDVLGVRPVLGRTFVAEEDVPGRDRVVVLAEGLWRRLYGGDAGAIGSTVALDGTGHTVIGVVSDSAAYPATARLWTPLSLSESARANRGGHYLGVLARLRPDATVERAGADVRELAARLEAAYPESNTGWSAEVVPLHEAVVGEVRTPLLILLAAVGLVLLVGCVNVASLLQARGLERRRELAIRSSLGASRRRLAGSLLAESLVLALLGGLLGVGLAWIGVRALVGAQADAVPRLADAALSFPVLAFALGATLLAGLVFGVLPSLRNADSAPLSGRPGRSGPGSGSGLRGGLVVAEIALAVVLLSGAGLLLKSFLQVTRVDPGFRTEGLLTFSLSLPSDRYESAEAIEAFYADLLERLEALPDVDRAAATFGLPLSGFDFRISVAEVDGQPVGPTDAEAPSLQVRIVTEDYFEVMGIPVVQGRPFTERDRHGGPQVAMVNEAAARLLWPDARPVGRDLRVGIGLGLDRGDLGGAVVGVVRDFRHFGLAEPVPAEIYVPHRQFPDDDMTLVLATGRRPEALVPSVRAALRELDPLLAMDRVRVMDDLLSDSLARRRFYATMLGLFGAVALLLAAVGVYGLMAFTVRQRTREIGIRMALGASGRSVLSLILRRAALLAGLGGALGTALALVATRPLAGLLYRLEPDDPATLAAVVGVLLGTALAAAALPAWRGARVDPMATLRTE